MYDMKALYEAQSAADAVRLRVEHVGQFVCRHGAVRVEEKLRGAVLQVDQTAGNLLAELYGRLMIGVDADHDGVYAHSPFEDGDQLADVVSVHLGYSEDERALAVILQRLLRAKHEGVEVVAAGAAFADDAGSTFAVL